MSPLVAPRPTAVTPPPRAAAPAGWDIALQEAFGVGFTLRDGDSGALLHAAGDHPRLADDLCAELSRVVARRAEPEFIADDDGVVLLAAPLEFDNGRNLVALAPFVIRPPATGDSLTGVARWLLADDRRLREWLRRQPVWSHHALLQLARSALHQRRLQQRVDRLKGDIEQLSANLASTYEEISLLYTLTRNLRLSSQDDALGSLALDWLIDCVPADGLALLLLPSADAASRTYPTRSEDLLLVRGDVDVDAARLRELIDALELNAGCAPLVANRTVTQRADWRFPELRQLIVTPLAAGDAVFGWLAAFNHRDDAEFGTVEASLLSSVAAIIGIHSGNLDLFQQQRELLASVVRALTSAIDAKDPYTCGHSDRVARVSVRLAQQLGCDDDAMSTLYMAGLVHDIGKIGIDDQVLRKPGRLTDEEYQQIKLHPELGYKILADIKQLADVLPIVLHHHEQWDGRGYPHGLAGEEIPFLARVCAVADAYDAMSSDRPYRRGMPESKVEEVFRAGSGQQWDADVVAAFFAVRDDIREICRRERANLTLDVRQWAHLPAAAR